ncbi:MAG: hypothetical protein IID41_14985, partial [Planctomycetes bacterium]|nr:hypothetical protein [Planctomycetota bacterium]
IEEGDDSGLSDAAAVADVHLLGTEAGAGFTEADDNVTRKIGYIGNKPYVRMTITPSGITASDNDVGAVYVLTELRKGPQTAQ